MVRQDPGTRSSSPGRTVLSATGSAAAGASASATRLAEREPQESCREIASPDSFDRSDSCGLAGRAAADSTPFPYQASAVGLQWFRAGDPRQREYRYVRGKLQRNRERMTVRGLNNNHNPEVK